VAHFSTGLDNGVLGGERRRRGLPAAPGAERGDGQQKRGDQHAADV
jgi:hypothetical protein